MLLLVTVFDVLNNDHRDQTPTRRKTQFRNFLWKHVPSRDFFYFSIFYCFGTANDWNRQSFQL
jgi:hypothetical protein